MINCLQVSFFLMLFFVTYLKGKIPGKVKIMKLVDHLIKTMTQRHAEGHNSITFPFLQEASVLLLSHCVFQFSKESSVF